MNIQSAKYVSSNVEYKKCPTPNMPEYAFIGRSNVGKSSLINLLTGRNKLAKISSTPGKTQLINHFLINDTWYLVDLPGYGWAKVSKSKKKQWETMIRRYLMNRSNLVCLFVLIDARIPPQPIDLEFLKWVGINQIPFVIVFTKTDKVTSSKIKPQIKQFEQAFLKDWEVLPQFFITSARLKEGKDEILKFIMEVNQTQNNKPDSWLTRSKRNRL